MEKKKEGVKQGIWERNISDNIIRRSRIANKKSFISYYTDLVKYVCNIAKFNKCLTAYCGEISTPTHSFFRE
jgi:hypothetical protein